MMGKEECVPMYFKEIVKKTNNWFSLYVLIMSRTRFRVNTYSIVGNRTHIYLIRKRNWFVNG